MSYYTKQHKAALMWYFLSCMQVFLVSVAIFFNMHIRLWEEDQTKLSFLIIGIWAGTTAWLGWLHKIKDKDTVKTNVKIGWYLAETCLAIGMVGTVAGFLLMLGSAFGNIDVSNTASLQQALANMAIGMSTALYTTLVGLVASIFLKSQLVNLEHCIDGLE